MCEHVVCVCSLVVCTLHATPASPPNTSVKGSQDNEKPIKGETLNTTVESSVLDALGLEGTGV